MKSSSKKQRTIKIETSGDYYRNRTFPKIRLQGKWLESLGFHPSGRVIVRSEMPGELTLKFIPPYSALKPHCGR
jgi:hypothetical protein